MESSNGIAIDRLIGTWRVIGRASHDQHGNPLPPPDGTQGSPNLNSGLLSINANGRMMAVLCDGRPGLELSPRDYSSYCGHYSFDGATLVTTVDASPPERIGTKQVRKIRFDDDVLVLIPPPLQRTDGTIEHREVYWQRVSTLTA